MTIPEMAKMEKVYNTKFWQGHEVSNRLLTDVTNLKIYLPLSNKVKDTHTRTFPPLDMLPIQMCSFMHRNTRVGMSAAALLGKAPNWK